MSEKVLLNETYAIEASIEEKWCDWMNSNYIPLASNSGLIEQYIFSAVNNGVNEGAVSYALQFVFKDRTNLWNFEKDVDRALKSEMSQLFAGKYASFPTILNIINKTEHED